jgi:hypothetical protein
MDPYLESSVLWSDFHCSLAARIQRQLNPLLQPDYYATLAPYVTYDLADFGDLLKNRPDIAMRQPAPGNVAQRPGPAITPAPVKAFVPSELDLTLLTVEIRTVSAGELVTVIAILSPINKRPGHEAHDEYLRKRRDLLRSSVHLIEIDLLRGGCGVGAVGPTGQLLCAAGPR